MELEGVFLHPSQSFLKELTVKQKQSRGKRRAKKYPKSTLVGKSCYGKTIYPNQHEAEKGMTMVWAKDPTVDMKELFRNLHAYKCVDGCNGWHFGHLEYFTLKIEKTLHGVNNENRN